MEEKSKALNGLINLRKEKKLTQKEVAHMLGISSQAYGHYEQGIRDIPINTAIALSLIFEKTIGQFVDIIKTNSV